MRRSIMIGGLTSAPENIGIELREPFIEMNGARIARTLRARLAQISDAMAAASWQCEQSYCRADTFLDEFDDLPNSARQLRAVRHGVELCLPLRSTRTCGRRLVLKAALEGWLASFGTAT